MVRLPIVDQMISLVRKPPRGGAKPAAAGLLREDRYRVAFEQAPLGIAYVGTDGHWLQYNERFREAVGYNREQLQRISFNDLTHPDDAKKELAQMRKLIAGEAEFYRLEKRIIDKRGKYRAVDVTTGAVRNEQGVIEFYVHVLEDPTTRQSGEKIREGEQLLVGAIDQLSELAIIRSDDRGTVTGWNAGAEKLFGYTRDEVVGKHRRLLYRDADNWEGKPTNQLQSVQGGRLEFEDWRVARNGQHIWVQTSITPLRREGVVKGYIEVITAPAKRAGSDAQTSDLKRTIETLREEVTLRERREESLRDALEQVRVMGEETMNELRIMTVALRNEIDRRKHVEDELRAARQQLAAPPPIAAPQEPVEQEVIAPKKKVAPRAWKALGGTPPAEMLVAHATEQRTGTLIITSAAREKEIFFDKGKIFSVASNDPQRFLTQRLIEQGYITEEQRQKALEIAHETHLAIGRILVILGAITEQQLIDVMLAKTEDEIADVFEWRDAKYVFIEGEIPALQLVPLRIDVASLVVKRLSGAPPPAPIPGFDPSAELGDILSSEHFDFDETEIGSITDRFDADATQPIALRAVPAPPPEPAPEPERAPAAAPVRPADVIIGSTSVKSTKYHRASCMNAKRIAAGARREFASEHDAKAAGLAACGLCFK